VAAVPPLHHVAVRVEDCGRALRFYSELLGLRELRRRERDGIVESVWLDAGGVILMVERTLRGSGAATGSGHVLAFAVDDLAAWAARLRAAGQTIDDRTDHTLYTRDPDGHRVGLTVFPASE